MKTELDSEANNNFNNNNTGLSSIGSDSHTMPTKDVNDFRYHRLEKESQYNELQFRQKEPKIPYKAILIAIIMFVAGSIMIIIGALLFTGHISSQYSDKMWPMLILGSILFIPGVYHVRIAYCAWRKYEGYSFEDIPSDE